MHLQVPLGAAPALRLVSVKKRLLPDTVEPADVANLRKAYVPTAPREVLGVLDPDADIVVPDIVIPEPAEYVVLVSVELMVKLGYDPDTEVAPDPVRDTVWSGALLVMVEPEIDMPVPAEKLADEDALITPLPSMAMLAPAEKAPLMLLLVTRLNV